MIPASGGRRSGVPALWAIPLGILFGSAAASAAGILSGAVLLDMIAWWPVWFLLGAIAWRLRGGRLGVIRASGLVPLLGIVATVVFLVAHIQGWALMPSASGRLIGPEPAFSRAALVADIDGWLRVDGEAGFLYEAFPIRWGGQAPLPVAVEQTVEDTISVHLRAQDDSMFQSYRGWDLSLAPGPLWDLTLAGTVEADLSPLEMTGLDLSGEGWVVFGQPRRATDVKVSGSYTLVFPFSASVRVVGGPVSVPPGWTQLPDGWSSPVEGPGWVVTVSSDFTVVVATQG